MKKFEALPEPSFERISGLYARPRTKRILINGPMDYKLVEVRPDLTILMKDATLRSRQSRIGYGFEEGENPEPFDFRNIEQYLLEDCIPVVTSKIRKGSVNYEQTAFTADNCGKRSIHMRLEMTNLHPCSNQDIFLWFSVIQKEHDDLYEIWNEDYLPFETLQAPWLDGIPLEHKENCLLQGDNIVLCYQLDSGIAVEYIKKSDHGRNMLKFRVELAPGEKKSIDITAPYEGLRYVKPDKGQEDALTARSKYAYGCKTELCRLTFVKALEASILQWKELRKLATQVTVPDAVAEKVYNTLTLNNLQMLARLPGKPYYVAGQGGFNDFTLVYGWESSHMLTAMDTQGYHQEVEKALDFFLSIQDGSKGPEGDIHSAEGTFRPSIHWMCETGAILGIFGVHYRLTHNKEWLLSVSPRLVKACRWIINERESTKQLNEDGTKVRHYGLLPKGRVHDWPDRGYFFFSDSSTYEGLKCVAEALADVNHPESERLLKEAEDYRECILCAVESATYTHPSDKANIFIASEVYGTPDKIMTSYGIDGPAALLATGLINPEDEKVPLIELGLRQLGILNDLFAVKLNRMEDGDLEELLLKKAGGKYDLYYVNCLERIWHKVWLERGEINKALNYFFSTLAFSTTADIGYCSERFCPQLPWLVPWQPNASGNGRIIEMIHRSLFYEKDGSLYILRGIPMSWLKPGNRVAVNNAITSFGKISFKVECEEKIEENRYYRIKGVLTIPETSRIQMAQIALRLPQTGGLAEAVVCRKDGKEFKDVNVGCNNITIPYPSGYLEFECIWDTSKEMNRKGSH